MIPRNALTQPLKQREVEVGNVWFSDYRGMALPKSREGRAALIIGIDDDCFFTLFSTGAMTRSPLPDTFDLRW